MRALLASLRRLILGETWTIPLGAALGLAVVMRAWLPHATWQAVGGFCLAIFVLAVLALSLRRAHRGHS
jgi:UDP-N-acetylmuramyl pentapeptide phosphotransferase/UDP-N-acetylglucosamine-1-phosphate transferase